MLSSGCRTNDLVRIILLCNILYNFGFKIQPVDLIFFCKSKEVSCTPCTPKISFLNALSRKCVNSKYILVIKASSTRIRKFVKTQIFFYEYGLRPYVSSVFSGRIRKFLKTLCRLESFLSDTNTYTCGQSYPEIFEYAFVILLDPVFTASIKNKHGVQQGYSFFDSLSVLASNGF